MSAESEERQAEHPDDLPELNFTPHFAPRLGNGIRPVGVGARAMAPAEERMQAVSRRRYGTSGSRKVPG